MTCPLVSPERGEILDLTPSSPFPPLVSLPRLDVAGGERAAHVDNLHTSGVAHNQREGVVAARLTAIGGARLVGVTSRAVERRRTQEHHGVDARCRPRPWREAA